MYVNMKYVSAYVSQNNLLEWTSYENVAVQIF